MAGTILGLTHMVDLSTDPKKKNTPRCYLPDQIGFLFLFFGMQLFGKRPSKYDPIFIVSRRWLKYFNQDDMTHLTESSGLNLTCKKGLMTTSAMCVQHSV